ERVDDLSGLRVESGAGFVEEDQTRTTDEGRGECDSLLLPAGETAHGAAGEVVQAQRFGQFVDGQRIAVEGGEVPQHLQRFRTHRQAAVLEHHTGQLRGRDMLTDRVVPD